MYVFSFMVTLGPISDVNGPANFSVIYSKLSVFAVGMIIIATWTD